MIYEYSFSVWPDEESPRMRAKPEIFKLFRMMLSRVTMEFSEKEFNDFRERISEVNLTLREIERIPHHTPESVR